MKTIKMDAGFPQRLRGLMDLHKIDQVGLSVLVGTTQATVSRWVNGVTPPSKGYLLVLTQRLRCSYSWLVSGTDPSAPSDHIKPTVELVAELLVGMDRIASEVDVLRKRLEEML